MKRAIYIMLLALASTGATAQTADKLKSEFVREQYNICWSIPDGFKAEKWNRDEKIYSCLSVYKGEGAACNLYWMGAVSKDRNCKLLYQMPHLLPNSYIFGNIPGDYPFKVFRNQVVHELYSAINGLSDLHGEAMEQEWNRYITVYGGKKAKEDYNADSVYIVCFPNTNAVFERDYNHCIGLYLCKANHVPILLKCLLNDESYKHKEQYIELMKQAVRYGDKQWRYNRERESKALDEVYSKLKRCCE